MRILFVILVGFLWIPPGFAQEACSAERAEIDRRLAQPGRSAQQIEQGEQLKQLLTLMCSSGGPQAGAMVTAQLDIILPPVASGTAAEPTLTKDDLTNDYLLGQWCRGGQEATSYDFSSDGSYRYAVIGFNVGPDSHHFFEEILPRTDFLERFDRLVALEADQFVTSVDTRGRPAETTYERGACSFMSVGAAG
jgi:hypothetical protein